MAGESGSSLYADVYIDNRIVGVIVSETCEQYLEIGHYYFARVKRKDSHDYPIVYCSREVPDCILKETKVYTGWSDFPKCKQTNQE